MKRMNMKWLTCTSTSVRRVHSYEIILDMTYPQEMSVIITMMGLTGHPTHTSCHSTGREWVTQAMERKWSNRETLELTKATVAVAGKSVNFNTTAATNSVAEQSAAHSSWNIRVRHIPLTPNDLLYLFVPSTHLRWCYSSSSNPDPFNSVPCERTITSDGGDIVHWEKNQKSKYV